MSVVRDALIHLLAIMALIFRNDTFEEAREEIGRAGSQVCQTVKENWQRAKANAKAERLRHAH